MAKRVGPGRSKHPMNETNVGADYTPEQIELGKAMDQWKRYHNCPYPTYADVLRVAKSLGWRKVSEAIPR